MKVVDVHKKNLQALGYTSLVEWLTADTSHVYIGRLNVWVGVHRSKWSNPFSVKKYGLEESLQLYRKHVEEGDLIHSLGELEGCSLGCWCTNDDASGEMSEDLSNKELQCHGQVLIVLYRLHVLNLK